jgi:8-amino-7-oxononanoate synthase
MLGRPFLDASSNDYLGLSRLSVSRETSGAGASRLLYGTRSPHERLEEGLAAWLGVATTLLFSSGYAANVGALSCLAEPADTILSDALNHASIIDGCRLSRATTRIFPHRDLAVLEQLLRESSGTVWVVTESYFSMDGTTPDLRRVRALCDAHGAYLVVDEAHALGVFGAGGRGQAHAQEARPDVLVGTFGKAFGAQGAFVAGSQALRALLWNRARSFVFSTATSPALAQSLFERIARVDGAEAERARLRELCLLLGAGLMEAGFPLPEGHVGPIFPVLLGTPERAVAASQRLRGLGILCPAIRPPTIPEGTSRLRVTLTAEMTTADVRRITSELGALGPPP